MTQPEDLARETEIAGYQVLGSPPRRDLQALVDLAARFCEVPTAAINLITAREQHQVAAVGFEASICSRADSMCAAILHDPEPVFVEDASRDERFADNPFVTGQIGKVRFYAASQLVTPQGVPIGTLCVFDDQPRVLTAEQREALSTLADRVVDVLELGLRTSQLEHSLVELTAARDELRRSNEQLGVFAGQVSHDLRNPLTSVSMSLQMLQEQPSVVEDDDALWMVNRALGGAERMDGLIGELLEYAQVGGALNLTEVDLNAVAADVADDVAVALEGATFEVGELPVVYGDRAQLRALLQNLVANAAKFTRPGTPPEIRMTAERTARGWRIEVADNGPGVPAEDRERVFELFARRDKRVDGAGIGLATCRRIARAHGGDIAMTESAAGGALVRVDLPG